MPLDKPPFIFDQGIRLLRENVNAPKVQIGVAAFATDREGGEKDNGYWKSVGREQIAHDSLPEASLHRLAIVCDAGMGKSTTIEWLRCRICRAGGGQVAVAIEIDDLKRLERMRAAMTPAPSLWKCFQETLLADAAPGIASQFERLIRAQRLVLLFDGLDQAPKRAVEVLARLLRSPECDDCRVVVASRPYALELHWKRVFGHEDQAPGWRFARLDEFDKRQQCKFLGRAPSDVQDRIEYIPKDARAILSVPRVLYYLRQLNRRQLKKIRTASDVYYYATRKLFDTALRAAYPRVRSGGALISLDADVAEKYLASVAFWMTASGPRFGRVKGRSLERMKVWLAQRIFKSKTPIARQQCNSLFQQVAAMNQFLQHCLLEAGCPRQVQWRNRSLQEFYAGLYLAKYARPHDAERLWKLAFPDTDGAYEWVQEGGACYWTWRFAAEMPAQGRASTVWPASMAPHYRRPEKGPRRSTEMIYRSWQSMQRARATSLNLGRRSGSFAGGKTFRQYQQRVLRPYQQEFQEILLQSSVAQDLLSEFRPIPKDDSNALSFTMGSPVGEPVRLYDEGPYGTRVDGPFEMSCYTVTNAQYELYDSAHKAKRDKYSREDRQPVIYVSYFDAAAYCLWLGDEYYLPTEKEWEYACRAGTTTAYHTGRWLTTTEANFGDKLGYTSVVGSYPPNDFGLFDMHSNVWEWCDTWYHEELAKSDDPKFAGSRRVLRGGDGDFITYYCDLAELRWLLGTTDQKEPLPRDHCEPTARFYEFGFRLARRVV